MQLHSVARLARILAEPQELVDLLETAAHEARESLNAASVSIGYLERERGTMRTVVNVGDTANWEEARPADQGFPDLPHVPLLLQNPSRRVVSLEPPEGDDDARRYLTLRNKGSALVAPILLEGRVWGELYITRQIGQPAFGESDSELAEVLAAVLASGIAQAERFSQVEHLVYSDPLTGLANRRAVDLALERALVEHQVQGSPVSVVMADAIVLPNVGLESAESVANAILNALQRSMYPGGLAVGVASTSAVSGTAEISARRLMGWADEAQYAAKREGSSRVLLAGRDTPLSEPVERRRRRRSGPEWATNAERATNALEAGLRVLVMSHGLSSLDRLVGVVDAASDAIGATGWVVSTISGDTTHAVAVSANRDGLDVARGHDLTLDRSWLDSARGVGVLVRADDESADLARTRHCVTVAAAATDVWLVELLADSDELLVGVPATLRALLGSALAE